MEARESGQSDACPALGHVIIFLLKRRVHRHIIIRPRHHVLAKHLLSRMLLVAALNTEITQKSLIRANLANLVEIS